MIWHFSALPFYYSFYSVGFDVIFFLLHSHVCHQFFFPLVTILDKKKPSPTLLLYGLYLKNDAWNIVVAKKKIESGEVKFVSEQYLAIHLSIYGMDTYLLCNPLIASSFFTWCSMKSGHDPKLVKSNKYLYFFIR